MVNVLKVLMPGKDIFKLQSTAGKPALSTDVNTNLYPGNLNAKLWGTREEFLLTVRILRINENMKLKDEDEEEERKKEGRKRERKKEA